MILLTELNESALTDGKTFDGVAFGDFTDAHGREVSIKLSNADAILANTQAAIESTRTESGELVGLPIDTDKHNHEGGAGWIVGVELKDGLLKFIPKWTKIGRELIGEGIRRFFSPTIDLQNNVVLGGSLTNWPASRSKNGQMLLKPIELSQNLYYLGRETAEAETHEEVSMSEVTVDDLTQEQKDELTNSLFAELATGDNKKMAELMQAKVVELAEQQFNDMVANFERQRAVKELSKRLTGGTQDSPRGLPVPAEELDKFLLSLDPVQFESAQGILNHVVKTGLVEFSELGHGKVQASKGQPVPAELVGMVREAVGRGVDLNEWFKVAELGNASDYDLSEFNTKEGVK